MLGLVRDVVDEYQRSIDGDPSVSAIEDAAQRDAYRFRAAMLAESLDAWAAVRGGPTTIQAGPPRSLVS